MWPVLLDMTRDECKRVLRRLELEAYASTVSSFRAQGDLTKEKKRILQDLQNILSISTERHRAEVRRAVNDEKLATIADNIFGPNTTAEWLIEGRRLIPLMPRLVPQTAFTATANQAANLQAEKNACYPSPCMTGIKDFSAIPTATTPTLTTCNSVNKMSRPSSPGSNVVVLPSGMSIHIKGGLNTEEDEELQTRKRRRSQSTESIVSPSAATQTPRVTYTTTTPSSLPGMSPVKITISKSPQARTQVTSSTGQQQKVIIVSNSGQTSTPSILHRSVTVPVIKSSTSSYTGSNPNKTSIIYPNTPMAANGHLGNIVTVATSVATQALPTVTTSTTSIGTGTNTFLTPTMTLAKPRTKMVIPRHKFTQHQQQKPGVVIPMGPQPVHASPSQNIQIKTVPKSTPTIQIKQEGGMKIITQSLPVGTSKILPKPSQLNTPGTPVVVVSAGSSGTSTSTVTMVTRPISTITGAQPGTKILNITQGGKVISTSSTKSPNVLTVNPKTLHLTAVRTQGGAPGGKPNVIVVQKSQHKALQSLAGAAGATKISTSGNVTPFERELVSFLERQDSTKRIRLTTAAPGGGQTVEKKVIITTPMLSEAAKQRAKAEAEDKKSSSLLAELIQAAGILPEGTIAEPSGGEVSVSLDESTVAALATSAQADSVSQTKIDMMQPIGGNEWFEYDVGDEQTPTFSSDSTTAKAVQSILDPSPSTSETPNVSIQSLGISNEGRTLSSMKFVNPKEHAIRPKIVLLSGLHGNEAVGKELLIQLAFHLCENYGHDFFITEMIDNSEIYILPLMNPDGAISSKQGDCDGKTGLLNSNNVDLDSNFPAMEFNISANMELESKLVSEWLMNIHPTTTLILRGGGLVATYPHHHSGQKDSLGEIDKTNLEHLARMFINYQSSEKKFFNCTNSENTNLQVYGTQHHTTIPSPNAPHYLTSLQPSLLQRPRSIPSSISLGICGTKVELRHLMDETMGELDPENGLFSSNQTEPTFIQFITIGGKVAVQTENSSAISKNLDLLSSSLAQAQIDLDPYQFIEEIGGFSQEKVNTEQQNIEGPEEGAAEESNGFFPMLLTPTGAYIAVIVLNKPLKQIISLTHRDSTCDLPIARPEVPPGDLLEEGEVVVVSEKDLSVVGEESVPLEDPVKPIVFSQSTTPVVPNTFIPLQDLGKTTPTITIKTHLQPPVTETGDSVHVAVEPSSTNPDQMKMEDFASQQVEDKGDYSIEPFEKTELSMPEEFQPLCSPATGTGTGSGSDSQGDTSCESSNPTSTRVSSRKRRAPAAIDEDFQHVVGGWARSAMGLLQRICRYRGIHKEKGELGAASWFTQPVDPNEAPDYYNIVKKPMDFGTIRKKLEGGQYKDYDEFHSDMLQVRKNCLLYNRPSSAVRQDCDDVFNFYVQEYEKLVERWQKNFASSPKKARLDKSPVRP
ncbi:hypothetical protein ScPMuIL_018439 [Solemya velum]